MAEPWSAEWVKDWNALPSLSRLGLECMFDGPIPHRAVLDELAAVSANAKTIDQLINSILTAHGIVPKN